MRGQGVASGILDKIISIADENGVTLGLSPKPFGKVGLSERQLASWYEKKGFRPSGRQGILQRIPQNTQSNASKIQSTTPVGQQPSGQESTRNQGSEGVGQGQQGTQIAGKGQEEVAPIQRDVSKPEQMTPEEAVGKTVEQYAVIESRKGGGPMATGHTQIQTLVAGEDAARRVAAKVPSTNTASWRQTGVKYDVAKVHSNLIQDAKIGRAHV